MDRAGETAAHIVAASGHLQCLKALMEYHADTRSYNHSGLLPIHIATLQGHVHLVQVLCVRDAANISARTKDEDKLHSTHFSSSTHYSSSTNRCPLHLAAENGHVETITALLDLFSADPNVGDSFGNSPLHSLVLRKHQKHIMRSEDCFTSCATALVKFGALFNERNDATHTAIGLAATNGFPKIVRVLLEAGAVLSEGEEAGHHVKWEESENETSAEWNPNHKIVHNESEESVESDDENTKVIECPKLEPGVVPRRKTSNAKRVSFCSEVEEIPPSPSISGDSILDHTNPFITETSSSDNPSSDIPYLNSEIQSNDSNFAESGFRIKSPPPAELTSPEHSTSNITMSPKRSDNSFTVSDPSSKTHNDVVNSDRKLIIGHNAGPSGMSIIRRFKKSE